MKNGVFDINLAQLRIHTLFQLLSHHFLAISLGKRITQLTYTCCLNKLRQFEHRFQNTALGLEKFRFLIPMSRNRNSVFECLQFAKEERVRSSDVPCLNQIWALGSCLQICYFQPSHFFPLRSRHFLLCGLSPSSWCLLVFFIAFFGFGVFGLFLILVIVFSGAFLMLLEDFLEVVIVFASEYILVLLDDIHSFDVFCFFLFRLLDALSNDLPLFSHLLLILLLSLLLFLSFLFQTLHLLSIQLCFFSHTLITRTIYLTRIGVLSFENYPHNLNEESGKGRPCTVFVIHIIRGRMLRSLLLKPIKNYQIQEQEEVLFPDIAKQNNRETLNSRELFDSVAFVRISSESGQLRWQLQCLESYEGDRLRFVARVEVSQAKTEQQRNELLLVREPVFSSEDVITFLIVLRWFPNAMKTYKPPRKTSCATDKDIKGRSRKAESAQLLQLVFLLSEKIYVPERYVDEFVHAIAERNKVNPRQANCLTVVLPCVYAKENYLSTKQGSSQSQAQYQEYLYDNGSNTFNRSDHYDRSSLHSGDSTPNALALLKRRSARNSQKSPRYGQKSFRNSEVKAMVQEQEKRRIACNLPKVKRNFSTVEYLITEGEVGVEMIMCHLNDDRNTINNGLALSTVKQLLQSWPKHNQFSSFYQLNREFILQEQLAQSLSNYRFVAALELSQLTSISIDAIYIVVRELNAKAMAQFLAATKQFLHDPSYNDCIAQLEGELCSMQAQLINNYALGKYEQGQRLIKDMEKRRGRKGTLDNCLLMRLVGREEVGTLDIGFKMYRQLVQGRLSQSFKELGQSQGQFRGRVSFTGNNDEDMLANIEGRIEICEEKRRMLETAIELSEKQAQSLHLMIRSLEHGQPDAISAISDTQE